MRGSATPPPPQAGRAARTQQKPAAAATMPIAAAAFSSPRRLLSYHCDAASRIPSGHGTPPAHVQEDSDRQPRRDRLPHHQDGAQARHQDGGRLFGGRPRRPACRDGRRGGADRPGRRRPVLSGDRQDRGRLQADRRRGRASGLRLPVRARGLPRRPAEGRHRLHRSQPQGDRRHGRQDREQEGRRQGQGLDRARLPRRDRRPQAGRQDRRRDRLSRDDQGLRRRRRQGHAHRLLGQARSAKASPRRARRPSPASATTACSSRSSS